MASKNENVKKPCDEVLDRLAEAIDGELPEALASHVEACDACRDLVHDAGLIADRVREAGDGYVAPVDLEDRVTKALEERASKAPENSTVETTTTATMTKTEEMIVADPPANDGGVEERVAPARAVKVSSRAMKSIGAALAIAAAVSIGVIAIRHHKNGGPNAAEQKVASAPWKGTVSQIEGGAADGLTAIDAQGKSKPARVGDVIAAGTRLRTDVTTRARITLDDGSTMVLDRGAEVLLDGSEDRTAKLVDGSVVATIAPHEGAAATIALANGKVESDAAKVSLTASKSGASIAIARGVARVSDATGKTSAIGAGEGGTIDAKGASLGAAGNLATAFAWSELGETDLGSKTDIPGLGELRARLPGSKDDGDKALRLTKQSVTVRVAGELARTEIDQTFQSDDPAILEGIYRFPLPPDAQIERLALEVDGKMQEGAFVDKNKGAAIWNGVTYVTAPKPIAPRPNEEWIWVPGPWHDPALLEWKQGGRMELKIYPIPAKGSRRVVLAYTQRIAPSAGVRRYVYPLPQTKNVGGATSVDDFSLDVQVVGEDLARGVQFKGYPLTEAPVGGQTAPGLVHATFAQKGFAPTGDLVVEYARKDEGSQSTSYAYQSSAGGPTYVALSLSPKLPRASDGVERTDVIVVDASRSMVGERYQRASEIAARIVKELDPRDHYAVMACDVACVPMQVASATPTEKSPDEVKAFLAGISADGATDLVGGVKSAANLVKGEAGRALRVIYVGDGTGSIGARTPAELEAGVRKYLGADASLTAVAIGADADVTSLEAMARGGGGVVIPYVPGAKTGTVALQTIEAVYGVALKDPVLTLPAGLSEIAPTKMGALRAGADTLVVAKMDGAKVAGDATLSGTVGGKPWSTKIPIDVQSTSDAGNAFVPRLWAATEVADLENASTIDKKKIVELSETFAVPSRFTSLIVLESAAMSKAFGVDNKATAPLWTGEDAAVGQSTTVATAEDHPAEPDYYAADPYSGGGGYAGKAAASKPSTMSAPPAMPAKKAAPTPHVTTNSMDGGGDAWDEVASIGEGPGHWARMRREWFRVISFANDATSSDLESKIADARAAVIAKPDSRDKLAELFGLVARRPDLTEAQTILGKWLDRDPLDAKAILAHGDLLARMADRKNALRVESGALDARPDDVDLADGLALVAWRQGDVSLACAFRSVHADVKPGDVDAVARKIACARSTDDASTATTILAAIDPAVKTKVEARIEAVAKETLPPAVGDLVIDATWSSGTPVDVDLAVVDAKGERSSWATPKATIKVADATSTTHETLALPWVGGPTYTIEVTRPSTSDATPISGTVTARINGQSQSFPFTLNGARAIVGRVNVGWSSRLVPY